MASPTFEQRVDRSDDRAAMNDTMDRARQNVLHYEAACAAGAERIRVAQARLDAMPPYDRGWPIELIVLLAGVAIVLEWYPARMMSLVFFSAAPWELTMLTAAFAVGGFLLGLLLGELFRRHRKPQGHSLMDWLLLGLGVVATAGFLAMGYQLRFGYASSSSDGSQTAAVTPAILALALTMLAFIGIVVAVTCAYYRESGGALRVRWRLGGLHRNLTTSQRHLEATRRELDVCERAYERAERTEPDVTAARPRPSYAGSVYDDVGANGASANGTGFNGASANGTGFSGTGVSGAGSNGAGVGGASGNGSPPNGTSNGARG